MVYQAVDSRRCGHWVFEDALPLGKGQVACEHHAASLIAFSQQNKEYFHLLPILLDIADVVDDQAGCW